MDFDQDVTIDESALDIEWLEQPRYVAKYGRHAAEVRKTLNQLKEKLEYEKAELDKNIREKPENFELSKITEIAVQNTIILQKQYQDLLQKYLSTKYEYDVAQVAVAAIEAKKSSLENLVKLHGMNYFAGPSVPRELTKEWQDKEKIKRADEGVKKVLQRTKR